ncbi:MAG TPA: decaprenyl-phosphate phosphoribosyltransferase [Candidatus Binatia bacterium]|nr:decaprenyl-phosphate phosphoribosyltransferase [Candidatus Binatia bacterium]
MIAGGIADPSPIADAAPAPMRVPLVRLLRPSQWVKNGFVLGPYIFTGSFLDPTATRDVAVALVAFCLASSANYVVNDLRDVESDRAHPTKRFTRPLAAGAVTSGQARVLLALLYAAVAAIVVLHPRLGVVLGLYLAVNAAYSFALKSIPVVDLFTLASSFMLRIYAGGVALDVPVSFWMFVTTLCAALYLVTLKRRQELATSGASARAVLRGYTVPLLDFYALVAAAGAFIFYGEFVYTIRPALLPTVPLVLFGFFRYRWVVEVEGAGESPTDTLLEDPMLVLAVLLWLAWSVYTMWPR